MYEHVCLKFEEVFQKAVGKSTCFFFFLGREIFVPMISKIRDLRTITQN